MEVIAKLEEVTVQVQVQSLIFFFFQKFCCTVSNILLVNAFIRKYNENKKIPY